MLAKTKKKAKKIDRRVKTSIILKEDIEMDPRKSMFKAYFMDPLSTSYGNYLQSALRAGFSKSYAANISVQGSKWVTEILGKQEYLDKARSNLKRDLDADIYSYATKGKGKNKKKIKLGINSKVMQNVQNATFFVLEKIDQDFKIKEKNDPLNNVTVDLKQVIIIAPNANPESAINYKTDGETVPSISTP